MVLVKNLESIGVVLAAGGIGSRMQSAIPKQFLAIDGKPIVQYSLELFAAQPEIHEIVIVCSEEYRHFFSLEALGAKVKFALPGKRRQDSVYNGFMAMEQEHSLICVHDAARPFVTLPILKRVLDAAKSCGAAASAMPVKFTVKQADPEGKVIQTYDRATLWEIQTPQALTPSLLKSGYEYVLKHEMTVTDDVSLVELLGKPVQLVEGSYSNIKITTPEDLP